jgi:glutaredoxin
MLISLTFSFNSSPSKVYALEGGEFNPSPSPVIGELFTGAWCPHCPYAGAALEIIQLTRFNKDEFFYLAYHYNDAMATSESTERTSFYKVSGFPSLIIGGTNNPIYDRDDASAVAQGYGNVIDDVIKKKRYIAQIAISGSFDNNEFNVKILATEDFGKRNINMVAVLYEDYVNFEGPNGDCFHRYVVRNMPYGSKGRGLIKLKKDQVFEDTRKFVLSTKAKELVGLVVFLQDMDTKEIVGSGVYRFASKPDAVFYWGDKPGTGAINLVTCKNNIMFKVKGAVDLKEIFLQIKLNSEFFDIVDVKISEKIGSKNADLTVDPGRGEVKCTFKNPINGDSDLFSFVIKFKKETDNLQFPLRKFIACDSSGNQVPFILYDAKHICYLKIIPNKYDVDANLSVNNADLTVLINCFGTFRKDKDYNKKCDFNKDSRIDLNDLVELIANLEE